jgi:hypothetical protein
MWDCDRQSGRGTGFFPVLVFSPVIIPYSFSYYQCYVVLATGIIKLWAYKFVIVFSETHFLRLNLVNHFIRREVAFKGHKNISRTGLLFPVRRHHVVEILNIFQ